MYTEQLLHYFCFGLPTVILGTLLALPVIKRVDHARFRDIVLFFIDLVDAACFIKTAMG